MMREPEASVKSKSAKSVPKAGGLIAVDRLLLWALAVVAALAGMFHPNPFPLLLGFASLAFFVWISAKLGSRSRAGDVLHAFMPFVVIVVLFETVGFVVGVTNPARWDSYFAQLDLRLFGPLIATWRGAFGRPAWLSDILSASYVSYYVVPPMIGLALYRRGRREDFDQYVFGFHLTLLISYAGYFLFPTAGPRLSLEEGRALLGGGPVSEAVRLFIHSCEYNSYDAFPSGHTAASLVFLAYGWRMLPTWRLSLALTTLAIIFSTVYLSHHYLIDLFAGVAVALLVLAIAPIVHRIFGFTARTWVRNKEPSSSWFARVFTARRDS